MTREYIKELDYKIQDLEPQAQEITKKDWEPAVDEKGKKIKGVKVPTKDYVLKEGKRIYAANSQIGKLQQERDFWKTQFDRVYKSVRHQMHLISIGDYSPLVKGLAKQIFEGMEIDASAQKENYKTLVKQISEVELSNRLELLGRAVAVWQN